ncbi:HEPN domain-containing protein [Candidatus Sulfurimonas baltica]|uniref:RiboL-PSP-HEPN domain-containing protein n=1 Tax=Candidatus Sulfurimonas baltica TaxID=2740404 RepID=A0A7S7LVW1_9BACT|nr:HEPN domain-containing protein [Candidatus Sulfurimonas baltica]QOY52487.1 hypothetical protein HUE88_01965 [Candidatus Sulfurimonas baltica]
MSAKQELFDRLQYLDLTIKEPYLVDNGVGINNHNGIANLLRKGLGIVAFNILEDYIKKRTSEALVTLSSSNVQFTSLPESLQNASIRGALNSLNSKANMLKKNGGNWQALIQDEALKIHSTKNPTFQLSDFSLVSSGSNVTDTEIADVIRAFGITGGWNKLGEVSTKIGSGIPILIQVFKNATSRRHSAAHDATFQYNYGWLEEIKNDIISISSAFDILLIARNRQINANYSIPIDNHTIENALNFRFLETVSGTTRYRETTVISGKARKIWDSLDAALIFLKPRLLAKDEFLIILNEQKRIIDWHS